MATTIKNSNASMNRRSFMKTGVLAGSVATFGASLLATGSPARAQQTPARGRLNAGDAAILRFLAAAELIESDLWTQYAELGGNTSGQPVETDPNQVNSYNAYQTALSNLDTDGPQYITSNTLDEVSHAAFLNAYLESRGAEPVNFDAFRTLSGSQATGSSGIKRLTNDPAYDLHPAWKPDGTQIAFASGRSVYRSIAVQDQKIIVSGDVATVRHNLAVVTVNNGKDTPSKLGVLLVWQKQPDRWRLVARQSISLPS